MSDMIDRGPFPSSRLLFASLLLFASVTLLASPTVVMAQGAANTKKALTSENVILTTKDNVTLHATYFPSSAGKNAPVVILLHGKGGNRLVWQAGVGQNPGFAQALQMNDFAVLCVDLRGHGENIVSDTTGKGKTPNFTARDHQAMVALDLEAAKKFLLDKHQQQTLNVNKLAIVAADMSASIALLYADLDWSKEPYDDAPVPAQRTPRGQDVRALVLISPDTKVNGLNTLTVVPQLRALRLPTLLAVGKKDSLDKGQTKKLQEQLMPKAEEKPHVQVAQFETNARGTDLLNKNTGLELVMYRFLDENVKKAEGDWRDRKSPLMD